MKALELADELESDTADELLCQAYCDHMIDAAAELRRLAAVEAELDELKAELEDAKQAAKTWENEAERRSDRYTKCAAELERIKALEPVMVYHGACTIDCGEHGHHHTEMLKMIPAGTKLYALGSKTA
jgi:hypothetical protein